MRKRKEESALITAGHTRTNVGGYRSTYSIELREKRRPKLVRCLFGSLSFRSSIILAFCFFDFVIQATSNASLLVFVWVCAADLLLIQIGSEPKKGAANPRLCSVRWVSVFSVIFAIWVGSNCFDLISSVCFYFVFHRYHPKYQSLPQW